MLRSSRWLARLVAMMAVALVSACGDEDDDGSTGPNGSGDPILGTWAATMFSVNGMDQTPGGMSVSLTFTETTYSLGVMGDSNNIICETTTDCTDGGAFSYTATTATFDPGDPEEITLDYSISGSTMTLSGNIGGFTLTATLVKV
jgi:hypothetical protein